MRITRGHAIELARRLDLPKIVQQIIQGDKIRDDLLFVFGFPEEFYGMSEEEQHVFLGGATVVPLWDDAQFVIVVGFHEQSGKFVVFDPEVPFNIDNLPKLNWQQVMFYECCRLYEAMVDDSSEEEIIEIANQFRFNHMNEIIRAYNELSTSGSVMFEDWQHAMLTKLQDH